MKKTTNFLPQKHKFVKITWKEFGKEWLNLKLLKAEISIVKSLIYNATISGYGNGHHNGNPKLSTAIIGTGKLIQNKIFIS